MHSFLHWTHKYELEHLRRRSGIATGGTLVCTDCYRSGRLFNVRGYATVIAYKGARIRAGAKSHLYIFIYYAKKVISCECSQRMSSRSLIVLFQSP